MKNHGFYGGRIEKLDPRYKLTVNAVLGPLTNPELDLSAYVERRQGRCAYCDEPAVSCLVTDHGTPLCGEHVRAWHRLLAALEDS